MAWKLLHSLNRQLYPAWRSELTTTPSVERSTNMFGQREDAGPNFRVLRRRLPASQPPYGADGHPQTAGLSLWSDCHQEGHE